MVKVFLNEGNNSNYRKEINQSINQGRKSLDFSMILKSLIIVSFKKSELKDELFIPSKTLVNLKIYFCAINI